MKKRLAIFLGACAMAGFAITLVFGQSDGGNGPAGNGGNGGRRHHRPPLPAIVRALDVNGDGIIDASEIANAPAALKTLDKNGDGKLTPDEYLGPRVMGPPPGDDNGGPPGSGPGNGPDAGPPPGPDNPPNQ